MEMELPELVDCLMPVLLEEVREEARGSRRKALTDFVGWYQAEGSPGFTKSVVLDYKEMMEKAGRTVLAINWRLTAIRRLARAAREQGLMPRADANQIMMVESVRSRKRNWEC